MATKTNGAEFKRFYNDESYWAIGKSSSAWHEDEEITVNGVPTTEGLDAIDDDAKVVISGGIVFGLPRELDPSFEQFFKDWKKKQTTATLVVEFDKSKAEQIAAAIKAAGGKIV